MFDTHGYLLESHQVQTEDGYILTLLRIPRGKCPEIIGIESEVVLAKVPETESKRPAVLLGHGLVCSANMWFIKPPDKALPYKLADEGFDVWVANFRGTPDSKSHISLTKKSRKFWDFTFHELALFDIPAMINYILDTTGNDHLRYVGHSMGCSVLIYGLSIRPEYCPKVKLMIALAPAVTINHLSNITMKFIRPFGLLMGKTRRIYERQLFPHSPVETFKKIIPNRLYSGKFVTWMLKMSSRMFANFGNGQVEKSEYEQISTIYPASTSVKLFSHIMQHSWSGKSRQYDHGRSGNMKKYGQATPPEYDLSLVDIPVVTFYSDGDELCTPEDVKLAAEKLPNVISQIGITNPQFFHNDFLVGNDAVELVYDPIIKLFKKSINTSD